MQREELKKRALAVLDGTSTTGTLSVELVRCLRCGEDRLVIERGPGRKIALSHLESEEAPAKIVECPSCGEVKMAVRRGPCLSMIISTSECECGYKATKRQPTAWEMVNAQPMSRPSNETSISFLAAEDDDRADKT